MANFVNELEVYLPWLVRYKQIKNCELLRYFARAVLDKVSLILLQSSLTLPSAPLQVTPLFIISTLRIIHSVLMEHTTVVVNSVHSLSITMN